MHRTKKKWTSAKRTEFNGRKFDSKFEAGVAEDLEIRKKAGEIKDYDCQFKVECVPYNALGIAIPKCKVSHKVDFRVHENDGSFTLVEAKGWESPDYKRRRKWLENFWLPLNPDHDYQVIYQGKRRMK